MSQSKEVISPLTANKENESEVLVSASTALNAVDDYQKVKIVHGLEKFTLVEEEVKLELNAKPLDRYFFRNFGLYVKEVWFSFIYACRMFFKTYTNFRNFVPNVKRKWKAFARFWSENWKPLVFISRLGEFWQDFVKWVRTPRRENGTGRRRFFAFYIFAAILGFAYLMMYVSILGKEGEIIDGSYVDPHFYKDNVAVFWICTVTCAVGFIQSAFGFNNIYKRFLNTCKRYPIAMAFIISLFGAALYGACMIPFVNAFNLDPNSSNYLLNRSLVLSFWGLICIAIVLIVYFDGRTNFVARIFFSKGVDGSNTLSRNLKGWIYLLPALIPLFAFTFIPMINALLMGFVRFGNDFTYTGWTLFGFIKNLFTPGFVDKYMTLDWFKVTFEDPRFLHSLITTTIIAIISVPVCTAISVVIAVLLNSVKKLQSLFQTVYFLPYVTAMTAVTAVWRLILTSNGPLNAILGSDVDWLATIDPVIRIGSRDFVGFSNGEAYYAYSPWAYAVYPQMFGYIFYSIWSGLAFKIVIFLSGLQSIDKQVYQAAELDGASASRKFFKITVPLLAPILLFNTLTSLIGAFKVYTATKTLFLDSPRFETIVYYMFSFISSSNYDRGSAVAFLLFCLLLVFTLIRMGIKKKTNIRMSKEDKKIAKQRAKMAKKRSRSEKILSGGVQ